MSGVRIEPRGPLRGTLRPPADKSISHRAALLGAMADEPVRIRNYLEAADTRSTLGAARALGALVEERGEDLIIRGTGLHDAAQPEGVIDVGNAGTPMRLLPGWLAGQTGRTFTIDGDASIRRRPVDRVAVPLRAMGARIEAHEGRYPPFTIEGTRLQGIEYELPVASAQVKSCLLLAGLMAAGETTVVEPHPSRDHTERLLAAAGVPIRREGARITVHAIDELTLPETLDVPADLSSAAFAIAAGLLVPGSRLVLADCGVNRTRTGFLRIAQRMGGIVLADVEPDTGEAIPTAEPVSDIDVTAGPLVGTTIEPEEVPLAIDELPLVALLGCFAEGETLVRGAQELRVKESDRIAAVVDGLGGLGGDLEATGDGFLVRGTDGLRGGRLDAGGDHRMAMLGAVAGLASAEGVEVVGMEAASVSYPGFLDDIAGLR